MRYMMLIKATKESESGKLPSPEVLTAMGKLNEEMIAKGVLLGGEGLQPSSQGFRITNVGGKLTVIDGPFAETKELVAGYWIVNVASREDAIAWAKKVPFEAGATSSDPNARGEIEIREIADYSPPPGEGVAITEAAENKPNASPPAKNAKPKIRYFMAFKADADSEAGVMPPPERVAAMGALVGEMAQAGVLVAGEGLRPSSKGVRVVYENGKRTIIDGPFAETKELIAGFCVAQVDSKEEALEWAKRGALVQGDCLSEVRRIYGEADFGDLQEKVPEVFEKERAFRASTQS